MYPSTATAHACAAPAPRSSYGASYGASNGAATGIVAGGVLCEVSSGVSFARAPRSLTAVFSTFRMAVRSLPVRPRPESPELGELRKRNPVRPPAVSLASMATYETNIRRDRSEQDDTG